MRHSLAILLLLGAWTNATAQTSAPAPSRSAVIKMFDQDSIDKWAECSWKKAPVSTENWLKVRDNKLVSVKPSSNPMASPKSVLELRLDAACGYLLAPSDRGSISFSVERAKAGALRKLRPTQIPSGEAKSKVLVCEISAEGMLFMTVLSSEGKKPKSQSGMQARCFGTLDDGSLINA